MAVADLSRFTELETVADERARELFAKVPKNDAMIELVGWRFLSFDGQNLKLSFTPQPYCCNPMGMVHGGFVANLLDETMGSTIFAATSGKQIGATITATIEYIRPAMLGTLEATGRVRHFGKSIAFVEGELRDVTGQLLAKSSASFKIVAMPS